jgi:molybdopterin-binding protein
MSRKIPSIPTGLDPQLRNILSAIREVLNAGVADIGALKSEVNNLAIAQKEQKNVKKAPYDPLISQSQGGVRSATVFIYQRTELDEAPVVPSDGSYARYDFKIGILTNTPIGWSSSIPGEGGSFLWVSHATASSPSNYDNILDTEWSAPQKFVKDGAMTAIVNAYQRSSTPLTSNPGDVTYTFSAKAITSPEPLANGWLKTIPEGVGDLYVTQATAFSNTDEDVIAAAEWSSPVVMSKDGVNTAIVYIYQRATSAPSLPSVDSTYDFSAKSLTGLNNGWTTTVPAGTNPLYVSTATALSRDNSDTIASTEWASPVVLSQNGTDGINTATVYLYRRTTGTTPALPSDSVTYTFATGVASGVNNSWSQTIPSSGGSYLWVTTATALSTGATDTILSTEWATARVMAQDGAAGAAGLNTAIVYIYKRSAAAPILPSLTTTYDFAAKSLSGLNNGWTTTVPAGTDPLYVSTATASSSASTDAIAAGEWASPVILAQNGAPGSAGANGADGADGLNAATIYLFQRTASSTPPALPSATVTYTFATGAASGVNNGWTQSIPTTGGAYRWVTTATALSTGSTDTIAAGEWAAVSLLAQDGADGSSGANARSVVLTTTAQAFGYNTAGAAPSPASATVTATAYNTSGTVYYQFLKNGASVQNSTTATYAYTPQAAFGNMPDKIEVQIREGATTGTVLATDTLSMLAIQAGADAITVVLSNAAHTVPTDSAGNNGNYTGSGTTVRVFEGATELDYDGTGTAAGKWNVSASGSSITPGGKTDSGLYATYGNHSAMTADTASISYVIAGKRANGTAFSQTVVQTLSKSKQGVAGADGADGSAGVNSRAVTLTASALAVSYNTAGASPSPSSVTLTATAVNTAGTVYYQFFKNDVSVQNTTSSTYAYTPRASFDNMPDKIEVQIREGASTGSVLARDMVNLFGVKAGTDAITVVLSNSAHTIPTDSAGNNGNYAGSGTTVRVFEGATELTYGSSTVAGQWGITASVLNIVAGSKTSTGAYVTYGNHSAMSADTALIQYTVIGKRANGTAFSQTVTQTFSKSKQGATGATGSTGSTGTTGDSARRCYSKTALTSLATTPSTITTSGDSSFPANNSWGTGTVWQATPPVIVAGEQLYQSDGVYSPATGNTVWNVPYLSSLKVGQLSAITTETGTLTVGNGGHIKSGQTAFDTGTGFWIEGGATPKMSLGDATKGFVWNGTTFTVRGDFVTTSNLVANAATKIVNLLLTSPTTVPTGSSWTTVTGVLTLPPVSSGQRGGVLFLFDLYLQSGNSINIKWFVKVQYRVYNYATSSWGSWFDTSTAWVFKLVQDGSNDMFDVSAIGYFLTGNWEDIQFRLQAYHTSGASKTIGSATDGYCQLTLVELKR